MPQASWSAAADGSYWIDVAIGGQELLALIDLGMVDHRQLIGGSVEPDFFDQLKKANAFSQTLIDRRLDAGGGVTVRESGLTILQLLDPISRQPIGPPASLFVSRGFPMVPHRVGVPFFHALTGCRVIWDLDKRTWFVEYP